MSDQRICLKFCVKNAIKCSEAFKMLKKVFGHDAMSQSRVYDWYKRFREELEDFEDDARPGHPGTSITDENVEKIKAIVLNNSKIVIREVAEEIGISCGSFGDIFSNVLNIKRVAAEFVPKLLNFQQKKHRATIAEQMLTDFADDPELLKRVITGDETWLYGYDIEMKDQLPQWKFSEEPKPKKHVESDQM